MGIYIKGISMPEFGEKIIILTSSGYVEDVSGQVIDGVKAISVPSHGRLKDYNRIMKEYNEWFNQTESREYENMFYALYRAISDSRTILPSD